MFHVKPAADSVADQITTEMVQEALTEIQHTSSMEQASLIAEHANLVAKANRKFNLTRITSREDVLRLHIQDSVLALPAVLASPVGVMMDIGSGAGYPGVPLAILTGRRTILVDSVRKKADFLQEVVERLHLDGQGYWGRAEEFGLEWRGTLAVVTARGLARLGAVVELSAPLLAIGGRAIALKARIDDDELRKGATVATLCGFGPPERDRMTLPGGEVREIITFTKLTTPKIALPRRTGLAQRQPLG